MTYPLEYYIFLPVVLDNKCDHVWLDGYFNSHLQKKIYLPYVKGHHEWQANITMVHVTASSMTLYFVSRPQWVNSCCPRLSWFADFNPLHVELFREIYKLISLIPSHWNDPCNWNPTLWKSRSCLSDIVNSMSADDLVMQGPRASVAMVLT